MARTSTSSGRKGGLKEAKLPNVAETGPTFISAKVLCRARASKYPPTGWREERQEANEYQKHCAHGAVQGDGRGEIDRGLCRTMD